MKIGFVTPSISRKGGGLLDAVRRIVQELLLLGEDVVVYSCEDEYSGEDAALWRPVPLCLFATAPRGEEPYFAIWRDDPKRVV